MDSLVRALGRFVQRDIPYVIGGSSIILAFLKLIDFDFTTDPPTALLLLTVGIAHPVGYIVEGTMSLTPLVNTSIVIKHGCLSGPFLKGCFERWARKSWTVPPHFDAHRAYYRMYGKPPEETASIERVVFLKQIGTAIGSCWLVCSFLFAASWYRSGNSKLLVVAGVACFVSLLLTLFGWLQAMEANLALFDDSEAETTSPAEAPPKPVVTEVV